MKDERLRMIKRARKRPDCLLIRPRVMSADASSSFTHALT
jgi:hypothetical protein